MTNRFAVFGNPIAQSKSPQIHSHFASQFNLNIDYQKILSTEAHFSRDIVRFFENGSGCNVTAPFKQQAYEMCHSLTPTASRAKAVNTIFLDNNRNMCGHNSDGAGLVYDLTQNCGVELTDRHIMILGAGGATRGILAPIIDCAPASILLANRTVEKAQLLADDFADLYPIATSSTVAPHIVQTPDLLINATSSSLSAELPVTDTSLIGNRTTCYDLTYAPQATSFLRWAEDNGAAKIYDGRGMLVEQAAISFFMWTKMQPQTAEVIAWLSAELSRQRQQ